MRDRRAVRRFNRGASCVQMNPLAIFGGDEPTGVIHCPLLMRMERMELADCAEPQDVAESFDLRSEMDDADRLGVVTRQAEALPPIPDPSVKISTPENAVPDGSSSKGSQSSA